MKYAPEEYDVLRRRINLLESIVDKKEGATSLRWPRVGRRTHWILRGG